MIIPSVHLLLPGRFELQALHCSIGVGWVTSSERYVCIVPLQRWGGKLYDNDEVPNIIGFLAFGGRRYCITSERGENGAPLD